MKFAIVHVSLSYELIVCGMIPISTIAVLAPTIDCNSVRGHIKVSFGVALLSPIVLCVCVCKRKNSKSGSSLVGRPCIVGVE